MLPAHTSGYAMGEASGFTPTQHEHEVRIPYSLEIDEKIPDDMPYPRHIAEQIAADMIACGQVRMSAWKLLCDSLPRGDLRSEANADLPGSMCFMSGAYSQGPLHGLRRNTSKFPWVTLMVCRYIRSCTRVPFTSFVLQRNTFMHAHRDMNNAAQSVNAVLPCSAFTGGGVWVYDPEGSHDCMDGTMQGTVLNLTLPGVTFDPQQWHETRPWTGDRITIAIFTVRAVDELNPAHVDTLRRLEFALPTPPASPAPPTPPTTDPDLDSE